MWEVMIFVHPVAVFHIQAVKRHQPLFSIYQFISCNWWLVFQNKTPAKTTHMTMIQGEPSSEVQNWDASACPTTDCPPRTAIRRRWENFAKSRNEGAPANVTQFYGERRKDWHAVLRCLEWFSRRWWRRWLWYIIIMWVCLKVGLKVGKTM